MRLRVHSFELVKKKETKYYKTDFKQIFVVHIKVAIFYIKL